MDLERRTHHGPDGPSHVDLRPPAPGPSGWQVPATPPPQGAGVGVADVEEAMRRLGLHLLDGPHGPGPWRAESADGVVHEVTACAVGDVERWEMLRARTTALLGLEHENVVPLVGAMPLGDLDAAAPRALVLVWLPTKVEQRRGDDETVTAGTLLDALVVACRGVVALRTCGIAVPGAAAVASLLAQDGARVRAQLHPWPWCEVVDAPVAELSDVTRAVAGAVAQRAARARTALRGPVRELLATAAGPGAPAPGDLAMRAIELLDDPSVLRAAGPVDPVPDAGTAPDATGAGDRGERPGSDWRAIVRGGTSPLVVSPPQARRHRRLRAAGHGRTVPDGSEELADATATSMPMDVVAGSVRPQTPPRSGHVARAGVRAVPRTLAARAGGGPREEVGPSPAERSSLRALSRPRAGGRRRGVTMGAALLAAGAVCAVSFGPGTWDVSWSGTTQAPGPGAAMPSASAPPAPAPGASTTVPRSDGPPGAGAPESGAADPGTGPGTAAAPAADGPSEDPTVAARRATVRRIEVLAALVPVPAEQRAQSAAEVDARLGELVAAGPVRDADRALVERVLEGAETPPRVRAHVIATELVSHDEASATVAMTYALLPDEAPIRQSLRLVLVDGAWKVASVSDSSGQHGS